MLALCNDLTLADTFETKEKVLSVNSSWHQNWALSWFLGLILAPSFYAIDHCFRLKQHFFCLLCGFIFKAKP